MADSQRDADRDRSEANADPAPPPAEEPRDEADTDAAPNLDRDDDVRSRFRAVLERKRGEAKERSARGHGAGASRIGDVHRRAGGKRAFRRKSG